MQVEINSMSLAQLVAAVNLVGAGQEGFKPIKSVPSKAKGVERVEALLGDAVAVFSVDDAGELSVAFPDNEPGEDEEDEPVEPVEEAAPFVKATKEELLVMGAERRAAYRKARRAAARAARKAKG